MAPESAIVATEPCVTDCEEGVGAGRYKAPGMIVVVTEVVDLLVGDVCVYDAVIWPLPRAYPEVDCELTFSIVMLLLEADQPVNV